jgi:hypothetical protein
MSSVFDQTAGRMGLWSKLEGSVWVISNTFKSLRRQNTAVADLVSLGPKLIGWMVLAPNGVAMRHTAGVGKLYPIVKQWFAVKP